MRSFPHVVAFLIFACCVQDSFGQSHSAYSRTGPVSVGAYHAQPPASASYCATCQGTPTQYSHQPTMSPGASGPPDGYGLQYGGNSSWDSTPQQYCQGGCYQGATQQNTCCQPNECCSGYGEVWYEECPPERCCIGKCFDRLWELEKRKNAWIFGHLGLR